jgi:hypothetical protein
MAFAPRRVYTNETRRTRVVKSTSFGPDMESLAKATLAVKEEDWLKGQARQLQHAGNDRLYIFATLLIAALMGMHATEARRSALMELHSFIMAERGEEGRGGYNGHLPNQLKKRPALRISISNLFIRAFGPNSYGKVFHSKTSQDFRDLREEMPPGQNIHAMRPRRFS